MEGIGKFVASGVLLSEGLTQTYLCAFKGSSWLLCRAHCYKETKGVADTHEVAVAIIQKKKKKITW